MDLELPLALERDIPPPKRYGPWGCTASGRRYYPADPHPSDFLVEDIAHALSNLCRFGGHVREFYSVAQHSVLVSHTCDPEDALWGLLHDASEAYIADIPRPLKTSPGMGPYLQYEDRMMAAICQRFRLPHHMPDSVRRADQILLATEARDLMPHTGAGGVAGWSLAYVPLDEAITPLPPGEARALFLERFQELT